MSNLPQMIVENNDKRKDTSHGLRAPATPGSAEFLDGLQDMLQLVELAKEEGSRTHVHAIINKWTPYDISDNVPAVMLEFGFDTWGECVEFVRNDECVEFMIAIAHYVKRSDAPVKQDRDFIDGEGIGLYRRRADRTDRTLEKCFDAKYHFNQIRPLEYLNNTLGIDCSPNMNYVHPGHPSFPAGHGGKFFESVQTARDTRDLSSEQNLYILTAATVLAMARSGGGVHYPEDNLASGYLAGLPEFKSYKA